MWDYFWEILKQNQFAQGGLVIGIVGGIIAYLRGLPQRIWRFLMRRYSVTLHLEPDDYIYAPLMRWLSELPEGLKHVRSFRRFSKQTVPGLGSHWVWDGWWPIYFTRAQLTTANGNRLHETLTVWFGGRTKAYLDQLLSELEKKEANRLKTKPQLFTPGFNGGWYSRDLPKRTLSSVILPSGVSERLVKDMRKFLDNEQYYRERNLMWHRGYLLEGVPGGGKSALALALAWDLGLSLFYLDPSKHGDKELEQLVYSVNDRSIVLLEDVDAMGVGKRRDLEATASAQTSASQSLAGVEVKFTGSSLSTLLNLMDGIKAREGVIYILTTNHKEHLDAALIRPGRIDVTLHFDHATDEQLLLLYQRFTKGNGATWLKNLPRPITMAEAQGHLLNERN